MSLRSRLARLKPLLILPPVIVGAGVLALAISMRQAPAQRPEVERATTVRVLSMTPMPFMPQISGFGVVEPARSWTATAQVAGRIAALHAGFRRGGAVEAGQEIARIADADYRIARLQAEAQVATLDARITEADLSTDTARDSLAIEENALAVSERELARQRDLVARGAAAAAGLEALERQTLTQLARVQDLRNRIALHPVQRQALEQERAAAAAALERAALDLERTVLRAPFDARVAEVDVEVDQFAPVGAMLGRLEGAERAEIDVQLPQSRMRDFVRVAFGAGAVVDPAAIDPATARAALTAEVRLRFEDSVAVWPATVSRPSAALDPAARAFGVILTVDNPFVGDPVGGRPPLFTGLFVEARLKAAPLADAMVVPRSAIRDGAVWLAGPDDRLARRAVTVAMVMDSAALVQSGLATGDRVVLTDLPAAIEGMLLIPVEDDTAAARIRTAAGASDR